MHVAVAIVGFRNVDDIKRCLQALEQSAHADFEVIICENGGAGAYADLCAALPPRLAGGQPVRAVAAPGNIGFAGGVNRCLLETPDADAWWVLNPDTAPDSEALQSMVDRLAAGDCEAVGCTVYLHGGRVQSHGGRWRGWLARPESIGHGSPLDAGVDAPRIERQQSYLNGASMLVGRRFVDTVGLMREEYFLYCEEVEWCLRGLERGMRLGFAQQGLVLHDQGSTTGAGEDPVRRPRLPVYLSERNKLLVTRDRFPLRLPVAALAALALLCVRYGRRGAFRQLGYALAGWGAGILDERGPPRWLAT
jgi:GT2 family glycosyltransferase